MAAARTLPFIAGELDLVGVDDDDVIADILMRGVRWLVLPPQDGRHDRRQSAHRLVLGIDQMPRALECSSGEGHDLATALVVEAMARLVPPVI